MGPFRLFFMLYFTRGIWDVSGREERAGNVFIMLYDDFNRHALVGNLTLSTPLKSCKMSLQKELKYCVCGNLVSGKMLMHVNLLNPNRVYYVI